MDSTKMITVLLSWTVHLTSYPHPEAPPELEYRSHEFFVENVCLGQKKCRVAGWYDDNGTIFLDERVKGNDDAMTRSLIVHELVHYLQNISGKFDPESCDDHNRRQREAYSVQRQYLNKIAGRFSVIYLNIPPCPHG